MKIVQGQLASAFWKGKRNFSRKETQKYSQFLSNKRKKKKRTVHLSLIHYILDKKQRVLIPKFIKQIKV